jgi:chromosome condensin MukBEF ATPase and DNA-binding subunit MukB
MSYFRTSAKGSAPAPAFLPPSPSATPHTQASITNAYKQSNSSTSVQQASSSMSASTTVQQTHIGGDAAKAIAAAESQLSGHLERLRQEHVGLEAVRKELESVSLTHETVIKHYQQEISEYKKTIETKTSELQVLQTRVVEIGKEKDVAVENATVSSHLITTNGSGK